MPVDAPSFVRAPLPPHRGHGTVLSTSSLGAISDPLRTLRCARQRRVRFSGRRVAFCAAEGFKSANFKAKEQVEDMIEQAVQESNLRGDSEEIPAWGEPTADEIRLMEECESDIPELNSIILTGRLGADPDVRNVRNGLVVCNFTLAVKDEYDQLDDPDDGGTSWFAVEAWGSLAKRVAAQGRKGLRVGVTGTFGMNSWVGRDGEQRDDPIVTAETFEVLQSRSEASSPSSNDSYTPSDSYPNKGSTFSRDTSKYPISNDKDFDDLPF